MLVGDPAESGASRGGAEFGGAECDSTEFDSYGKRFNPTKFEAAMTVALAEARRALATGDVPVGAVVLAADGSILSTGHNDREVSLDPTGHAEIIALRRAAEVVGTWHLAGCTLVVTLEPCTMCAGALVQARVARLVFGAWDDKAGAVGSLWDVVRDRRLNHRPEVIAGVLSAQSASLLTDFFRTRR